MYERRFGITGPPFQLSPDPSFYFDGVQHRKALTALRAAFAGDLPFIVLSGAIGAGKTTVLRTWLAELHSAGLTSVLITNTQLDSEGLLSAVALAMGVDTMSQKDDGVLPVLRQHLRGLRGVSCAITIDEAQNLGRPALSSLVDLTLASIEEGVRLRVVLAGQPELRTHVADHSLPRLQALVQQACHLDALALNETRRYIEHRLHKVGWSGSPSFDPAAFEEIHRLAGGVPRRVNVIANRLLLGQFLSDTVHVDSQTVRDIVRMLDAEITDGSVVEYSPRRESPPPHTALVAAVVLFLLVSGRSDYIKAMALMFALQARAKLSTAVVVCLRNRHFWDLNVDLHGQLSRMPVLIDLAEGDALRVDQLEHRFDAAVTSFAPHAVVAFDGDPLSHRCALLAQRRGLRLVHIGADAQSVGALGHPASPSAAIGQLANLRFRCQPEEINASRSQHQTVSGVGSLLVDALEVATRLAPYRAAQDAAMTALRLQCDPRRGFGVVVLKAPEADESASWKADLLRLLKEVSRDLPLVWTARATTTSHGRPTDLRRALQGERIAAMDELGYVDLVRLMRESLCVLTNSADVAEEAAILGVPCLSIGMHHVCDGNAGRWLRATAVSVDAASATRAIWQILYSGAARAKLPAAWDGHTGARISRGLMQWLAQLPSSDLQGDTQRSEPRPSHQKPT